MRMRYLRCFPIMLATFVFGVAVSPIHFYLESIGCGRVIDGGGGFSVSSYRSNYFIKLSFAHAAYTSPDKANEVFDQELNHAVKVIDVTPKINNEGLTVGRRAVAILFDPELNQYYASVFWTEGRFLHS